MKRSRYSESQIIKILKEGESGMLVPTFAENMASAGQHTTNGSSENGHDIQKLKHLRHLETENRK